MATAAEADGPSMKLQIVMDKKKNRVLFAEAKKDFVDFIFHILTLPLGTVQRILMTETSTILGSIGTLQEGLKNLDSESIEYPAKDYLLGIKAPYWGKNTCLLWPEATCSYLRNFYRCLDEEQHIRMQFQCNRHIYSPCLTREVNLGGKAVDIASVRGNVKEAATFMVMDDLVVRTAGPTSLFSLMNQHSINDVGDIEKREVTFGTAQAIKLLKASISSKTVLNDVFLSEEVKAENLC